MGGSGGSQGSNQATSLVAVINGVVVFIKETVPTTTNSLVRGG